MTRYKTILGQLGQGYRVEIIGDDGVRQTVLGFSNEDEATQWVEADRRHERLRQAARLLDIPD